MITQYYQMMANVRPSTNFRCMLMKMGHYWTLLKKSILDLAPNISTALKTISQSRQLKPCLLVILEIYTNLLATLLTVLTVLTVSIRKGWPEEDHQCEDRTGIIEAGKDTNSI